MAQIAAHRRAFLFLAAIVVALGCANLAFMATGTSQQHEPARSAVQIAFSVGLALLMILQYILAKRTRSSSSKRGGENI